MDGWILLAVIIVAIIISRKEKDYKSGLWFGSCILLLMEMLRWAIKLLIIS